MDKNTEILHKGEPTIRIKHLFIGAAALVAAHYLVLDPVLGHVFGIGEPIVKPWNKEPLIQSCNEITPARNQPCEDGTVTIISPR